MSLDLAVEDFSSEHDIKTLIEEINYQDPAFLIGIFVSLAVVIITIGEPYLKGVSNVA